ncbi:MAG TPA: methionyl-tRNA formyltransferase [Steroidobacteraceae bacterium]|nr:methionyl-tRNA formyltransferase [Steroidobacteraceae bacterium]
MTPLRLAFAGTPPFAVPALQALLDSPHEVVGVLTQPDRPKGRGRRMAPSPVKLLAQSRGVPLSQPQTLKTDAGRQELAAWAPDALIVVAYGLILPAAVLDLPKWGCINIHASLLPRWRGAAPIQRSVLAGDTESGLTLMQMDIGLDTGPILLQRSLRLSPTETGGTLHDRLSSLSGAVLLEALEGLVTGALRPVPQPSQGATYAAKIDKREALIDWDQDALHIDRRVRAFNPWPIAETRLGEEPLRIFAGYAEAGPSGTPGSVLAVTSDAVVIACGTGRFAMTTVQRAGRKPVAARDFANALDLTGRRLG